MSDVLPTQNNLNPWEIPQVPPLEPSHPDPIIEAHRQTAEHQQRDSHGRFVHEGNGENLNPNPPPQPSSSNSSSTPLPIQITQNNKYSEKNDPPLVALSVTNPVTYLKKWLGKLLKNEGIDIHIKIKPLTVIGFALAFATVSGVSFSIGSMFFPNSSPILHRQVVYSGVIQKGEQGQYYLMKSDSSIWKLRPKGNNINISSLVNKQAVVTGNLTSEQNLIEVSEVIVTDIK